MKPEGQYAGAVPGRELVEVEVLELRTEVQGLSTGPVLLLKERAGTRVLPIYIGVVEARAIKLGLDKIEPARPLTHDLALALVTALGASVHRVVVTEVRDRVFVAEVELTGETHAEAVISARPSDAVALAVRCQAPIFVDSAVMNDQSVDEAPTDDSLVDEFKRFLDVINPDDFAPGEEP